MLVRCRAFKIGQMRLLILTLILSTFWRFDTLGQTTPCQEGRTVSINEKGDSIVSYVEKTPFLKDGFEPYPKWIKNNMDKKLISIRPCTQIKP